MTAIGLGGVGRAPGWVMTRKEERSSAGSARTSAVAVLVRNNAALMGRVAMALLGDASQVELVLEKVARDAAGKAPPEDIPPTAWLLGLVRSASVVHLSKIPLRRTDTGGAVAESEPATERMGVGLVASQARATLGSLKPTEREAVVLAIIGGLDAKDVAAACNVDIGTAKNRIAGGLEQLLLGQPKTAKGMGRDA